MGQRCKLKIDIVLFLIYDLTDWMMNILEFMDILHMQSMHNITKYNMECLFELSEYFSNAYL